MYLQPPSTLKIAILALLGAIPVCCAQEGADAVELSPTSPSRFRSFWDQGKAEITSYDLKQARYGELHAGHSVLIFVREDFSRSKHVKLDAPGRAGSDATSVLKLNSTLKFTTGIYPYSVMQSVFTPTDRKGASKTLKVSTSAQEWCGHGFSQLDLVEDGYALTTHSYFESEGELDLKLPDLPLEDELWTLIRIDPSALPLGEFQLIPGSVDARLHHRKPAPQTAKASLTRTQNAGEEVLAYQLDYQTVPRRLVIFFEEAFPHGILGWEETTQQGRGAKAKSLTTKATRKATLLVDYWNRNHVSDLGLRTELGLP